MIGASISDCRMAVESVVCLRMHFGMGRNFLSSASQCSHWGLFVACRLDRAGVDVTPVALFNPIQCFQSDIVCADCMDRLCDVFIVSSLVSQNDNGKGGVKKALISAMILQMSTVIRTGLHNGSTEVLSLGWVLLRITGVESSSCRVSLGVVVDSACYWYLLVWSDRVCDRCHGTMDLLSRTLSKSSLCLGGVVLSLWAVFVYWSMTISSGTGNLLRIKGSAEMDSVRRTIGSADPLTYIVPWAYNSPDFAEVSRFGEQFVHSSYIGWVVLGTCLLFIKYARSIGRCGLLYWWE